MRDIALFLLIFGTIPFILRRPWIGILVGAWISLMNPHRYAFGFAYDFPFAQVIAGAVIAGMFLNKDKVEFPRNAVTLFIVLLMIWMTVTTLFALEPDAALFQWERVMKMFVLVLLAAMLIRTRQQIDWFIWTITISVGWFGLKGGIFTLVNRGEYKVYGPAGDGFISDNNAIPVAIIMVIPLMQYLSTTVTNRFVKWGLRATMLFSLIAVLGSYSRGALLAVCAMTAMLALNSRRKLLFGVIMIGALIAGISFMPQVWEDRMRSIQTYEEDSSAQGRINTWYTAVNLANARPLVGGGFEPYSARVFATYAPDPLDVHSAHSIYFQMLGEHGYVGLVLFLILCGLGWSTARRIVKVGREFTEHRWAANLAAAMKASLVGFAVGGAFVNISYWELEYYELIILAAVYRLVRGSASVKTGGSAVPTRRYLPS